MQSEEQRLIDGLFDRLKAASENSAPRDADAERWIEQHMRTQPGAAYYMAQTILIQEAAMKQLNARLQSLEAEVEQLKQSASRQQSSGGFLAGLFGGNKNEPQAPRPQASPRGSDPIPGAQQYQSARLLVCAAAAQGSITIRAARRRLYGGCAANGGRRRGRRGARQYADQHVQPPPAGRNRQHHQ